jgi:hypothetical protein
VSGLTAECVQKLANASSGDWHTSERHEQSQRQNIRGSSLSAQLSDGRRSGA